MAAVVPVAIVLVCLASVVPVSGALAGAEASEALPKPFNTRWCAYHTSHFRLLTDLRKRSAMRTVNELNRFRQLFLALFPHTSVDAGTPLTILVFRRHRDLVEMTGTSRYAGVTLPSMHQYRLLAAHGHRWAPTENALHEYAHYLLRTRTDINYPLWYEEGLATYLAAANVRRNPVQLGTLPYRGIRSVAGDPKLSFQATIEATSILDLTDTDLIAFYSKAWLLVHFVRVGHAAGFPDWRAAIAHYLEDPERDFAGAFGLAPESVDALLMEYLKRHPLPRERRALADGDNPKTPLAFRAGVAKESERRFRMGRQSPAANANADQTTIRRCLTQKQRDYELALGILQLNRSIAAAALERLPRSARTLAALALVHWDERERAERLLDEALILDPAATNANVQFAHLLVRDCLFSSDSVCIGRWAEAADRYRKALSRHPERYDAVYGLGVAYLHTGRATQAMRYLRQAYEKMPWEVRINYFLGEGYRIVDDPRAATHLRNARNWAVDANWRRHAEFALRRLKEGE